MSGALPSSQASLCKRGSSENSGVMPKQQPQPKQMTDRKEEQHGEQKLRIRNFSHLGHMICMICMIYMIYSHFHYLDPSDQIDS